MTETKRQHAFQPLSKLLQMALVLFFLASGYSSQLFAKEQKLTLGIHPYLSTEEIIKRFHPLTTFLAHSLDAEVEIKVSDSYEQHIDAVGNNIYDIAFLGPLSYVKMTNQFGIRPLLGRLEIQGSPFFRGKVITKLGSPVRSIADLKGKTFAFGSKSSTMTYLVPRHMIEKAGVRLSSLGGKLFSGSHSDVVKDVLSGKADAGAIKETVFFNNSSSLKAIATTMPISEHVFVAKKGLNSSVTRNIKTSFTRMRNSMLGRKAMRAIKPTMTGIVSANDSDYDNLRTMLRDLKL